VRLFSKYDNPTQTLQSSPTPTTEAATMTTLMTDARRDAQAGLRLWDRICRGLASAPNAADANPTAAGYLRTCGYLGSAGSAAVEVLTRAPVGAVAVASSIPSGDGTSAILLALRPMSAFQSLPGVVRVSVQRGEMFGQIGRAAGYVMAEGAALPMQQVSMDAVTLVPITVRCATPVSRPLLRAMGATNETVLGAQTGSGTMTALDAYILATAPAGTTVPAGDVTASAIDVALLAAIDALETSVGLAGARWVIPQIVLAHLIGLRSGNLPAYPTLPGSLVGFPVSVTQASSVSTAGQELLLVSPGSIILSSDETLEVERVENGAVEMSSAPSGNALTPTPTTLVSLWQANTAVIACTLMTAWGAASRGVVRVSASAF